jgi:hypothetical protein
MQEFSRKLRELRNFVKVLATGAVSGHLATVAPKGKNKSSLAAFSTLTGMLTGAVVGGGILVLRSMREASSSQMLGVVSARPSSTPLAQGSEIHLYGYCLQERRDTPDSEEEFESADPRLLDLDWSLLDSVISTAERKGLALANECSFVDEEPELFARRFTQATLWVVTDNIGYPRAKSKIFGLRTELQFFTPSCFEVLLWVRECLKLAGFEVTGSLFNEHLVKFVLPRNVALELVGAEQVKAWQDTFAFELNS